MPRSEEINLHKNALFACAVVQQLSEIVGMSVPPPSPKDVTENFKIEAYVRAARLFQLTGMPDYNYASTNEPYDDILNDVESPLHPTWKAVFDAQKGLLS
jgi:hypothetical protein